VSFILDALRKAEHARQMSTGATLAELPLGRRARGLPWWVFAIAALLLVNVVVLSLVLLRDDGKDGVEPLATAINTTPAPQPVSAPAPVDSLASAAEPAPQVEYETVPRSELDIANAAASIPDGPTIVRPSDSAPDVAAADYTAGELRLDLHVYSALPRDRFVLVGMKRYTEGERLPDGNVVEQITPDGVVLYQNGSRTLLHR
jgi:hypothetical protein